VRNYTLQDVIKGMPLITATPSETVHTAAKRMAQAYKGAILAVENDKLKGIFTERDLLIRVVAARRDPEVTQLWEVMTSRLILGRPWQSSRTALNMMVNANCRHLPVVEGDRVMGIVSRRQLMALDILEYEHEEDRRDPAPAFYF